MIFLSYWLTCWNLLLHAQNTKGNDCLFLWERDRVAPSLALPALCLRSLSSPDSHRSDMTDQDKWPGSDVRSVQSSNCPRQKQKGTLSTRLSSLPYIFNSFHPHYTHNKTVNIYRFQLFKGLFIFFYLTRCQTLDALSQVITYLLSLALKVIWVSS